MTEPTPEPTVSSDDQPPQAASPVGTSDGSPPVTAPIAGADDPPLPVSDITSLSADLPPGQEFFVPGPELGTVDVNQLWGADFGILN